MLKHIGADTHFGTISYSYWGMISSCSARVAGQERHDVDVACGQSQRSPEFMSLEELWREPKQTVAANRGHTSLAEVISRAPTWFAGVFAAHVRRLRRRAPQAD